jgi:hypothetical protein
MEDGLSPRDTPTFVDIRRHCTQNLKSQGTIPRLTGGRKPDILLIKYDFLNFSYVNLSRIVRGFKVNMSGNVHINVTLSRVRATNVVVK